MALNSNTRVTPTDVKGIFDTALTDSQLENHINAAASIVDKVEKAADDGEPDRIFKQIEQYLSAHIASAQDPRVKTSSVDDSSFNYIQPSEETWYWQTAESLDPTGMMKSSTLQVDVDSVSSR